MCLNIRTSYDSERAVAIRVENLPRGRVNWDIYQEFKDSIHKRADLATLKQSRPFHVRSIKYFLISL